MPDLLSHRELPQKHVRFRVAGSLAVPIFYFCLAAFLVTLATYGGLVLLNRAQEGARDEFWASIREKEEDLHAGVIDQIFLLDAQLRHLRTLLLGHVFTTQALNFVERTAHPSVPFYNFNFASGSRKIDMSGVGAGYSTVAEQMSLFEQSPLVEQVSFGGLSLGENNLVNFNLSLVFKAALLELRQ